MLIGEELDLWRAKFCDRQANRLTVTAVILNVVTRNKEEFFMFLNLVMDNTLCENGRVYALVSMPTSYKVCVEGCGDAFEGKECRAIEA